MVDLQSVVSHLGSGFSGAFFDLDSDCPCENSLPIVDSSGSGMSSCSALGSKGIP